MSDNEQRRRAKAAHWIVGNLTTSTLAVAAIIAMLGGTAISATAASPNTPATVTFAEQPGSPPNYVFPLQPPEFFTFANDQQFSYLLYRPLYWIGSNGQPLLNKALSIAEPPTFTTNAAHETVATITLKPYRWSDGTQVTTRDVAFWMNLLIANKETWGNYVPGQFPDNVKSIAYLSPDSFQITFDKTYNTEWLLYNELVQITPIPQHAWDKTSLSQAVGDHDETAKGAVAVWKFLNGQSRHGASYATSPLWKVVDGPWQISEYNPATGYLALTANKLYSGQSTHSIGKLIELPFTSSAAEFNALRAGGIDYGYIPLDDATPGQVQRITAAGYQVVPWETWQWNFWPVNYANPDVGSIFKQLTVRQALQHLIDQKAWIKYILHGYGTAEYSNIPTEIKNPFGDAFVTKDHYPFSVQDAQQLLRAHGWNVVPGGVTTCATPGTASDECGADIKTGAAMKFTLEFSSGYPELKAEVLQFKTLAAKVGITIALTSRPRGRVFGDYFSCMGAPASACHWQMIALTANHTYGWYPDYYPVGAANYNTGAVFNGQQYNDPKMNLLTAQAHETPGYSGLHAVEDYSALQLPTLWVPSSAYQISAIKNALHVPMPQGVQSDIYPEMWRMDQ